jgi:hypothetical protein
LQELLKRLQEKHAKWAEALTKKTSADAQAVAAVHTPNAKSAQDEAPVANKVGLQAEKENDSAQKEVQESPVKGILSSYSFLFLGTPGYYCIRKYFCWCKACSLVRGRGHGTEWSVSPCVWMFALKSHCLEGREVYCAAGSGYKAAGDTGSRVGCQGLALG